MKAIKVTREVGHNTIDTTDYPEYLDSIGDRLPPDALAYAGAAWHYDFSHECCPHDANLLSLTLTGASLPESTGRQPGSMELKLIGSHRNGMLKFLYTGVGRLFLSTAPAAADDFGDVLVDEISLAETGLVVHEIVFEKATLTIEAAKVTSSWEPLSKKMGSQEPS